MKKLIYVLIGLVLCGAVFGQGVGSKNKLRKLKITVLEDDGTPSQIIRYISFDNDNVTISGDTAYVADQTGAGGSNWADSLREAGTTYDAELYIRTNETDQIDSTHIKAGGISPTDFKGGMTWAEWQTLLDGDQTGGSEDSTWVVITVTDSASIDTLTVVSVIYLPNNAITDAMVANDITCANYVLLVAISDSADARITVALAANKTISGNWVNTTNPWAANELVAAVMVEGENASLLDGTNWRLFYVNGSGDVTELVLGADGTFLESNGAAAAPAFRVLAAGDIPDISATYEVQLNNEAGLYAVLSDVSNYLQTGDALAGGDITDGSLKSKKADSTGVDGFVTHSQYDAVDDWWEFPVDSASGLVGDTLTIGRNTFGATITIDSIYTEANKDNFAVTFIESPATGGAPTVIDIVTASTNGTNLYYITETTITHAAIEIGHRVRFVKPSITAEECFIGVYFHYTRP